MGVKGLINPENFLDPLGFFHNGGFLQKIGLGNKRLMGGKRGCAKHRKEAEVITAILSFKICMALFHHFSDEGDMGKGLLFCGGFVVVVYGGVTLLKPFDKIQGEEAHIVDFLTGIIVLYVAFKVFMFAAPMLLL